MDKSSNQNRNGVNGNEAVLFFCEVILCLVIKYDGNGCTCYDGTEQNHENWDKQRPFYHEADSVNGKEEMRKWACQNQKCQNWEQEENVLALFWDYSCYRFPQRKEKPAYCVSAECEDTIFYGHGGVAGCFRTRNDDIAVG